jgi:protein arginine kinase activator
MLCSICNKKKATVHLTEIVDEQMSEMHLCEECAQTKSAQMEQQFGLADLLAGLSDFGKQVKDVRSQKVECPNCGLSYEDFKKFGRLGCSECFKAFQEHLSLLLKKIHGANRHVGKVPTGGTATSPAAVEVQSEPGGLQQLKEQLQQAILTEDFERAAQLRDKIREKENT